MRRVYVCMHPASVSSGPKIAWTGITPPFQLAGMMLFLSGTEGAVDGRRCILGHFPPSPSGCVYVTILIRK